jgi:hypothetical protein
MNLEYIGDALDHWKGSLFSRLQKEHILKDLAADPMSTDDRYWREVDFRLYADLLQLKVGQVIRHKKKLKDNRKEYLAEIKHDGDLFVDPDIGVAPTHPGPPIKYITVKEIHQLLDSRPTRILCIYQHTRGKTRTRVNESVQMLRALNANVYFCSYESPTAAILFLSLKRVRRDQISHYFKGYLGRHSGVRIYYD